MNELRIVLDLSEDTKSLLKDLLHTLKPNCSGCVETVVNAIEAPTTEAPADEEVKPNRKTRKKTETVSEPEPAKEEPKAEEPAPAPVEEPKAEEPAPRKVELKEVQSAVTKACQAGKRDGAKAIIEKYAARVSAIPEDKFAEVLEQLEAL